MNEPADTSPAMEIEGATRWTTDILLAIEGERWEDAESLLSTRAALTADASSRLFKEIDSLIDVWRLQLQGLPERDSLRLVNRLRRNTFSMVIGTVFSLHLVGLRKFLNTFKDMLVKLAAVVLFAAPAAIAHHLVAAQIDRALDSWLWQYFALVVFIFAYKIFENPLEGALEKRLSVIRRWGLRAEARATYMDAIRVQQKREEVSSLRASLAPMKLD